MKTHPIKTVSIKTLALALLVSPLCTAAALAQTAAAQTAMPQDATVAVAPEPAAQMVASTAAASDSAQTTDEVAAETAATPPQPARTCLTLTGSRVTAQRNLRAVREGRPERECANSAGRVYSEDDIERTGQRSVADALRSLDTGIR